MGLFRKDVLPSKLAFLMILALLLLSTLFLASGCSSTNSPSTHSQKLRTPFIPPANESVFTGYQAETPAQSSIGNASLLLDNSHNEFHVKVALFKVTNTGAELTTICTIRKGETFTIQHINSGNYEVQFRNLNTGKYFKLEPPLNLTDNTAKVVTFHLTESGSFKVTPAFDAEF